MLTIKVGHAYTTNVTRQLHREVNMMGYGYEQNDSDYNKKEEKKCYDYSYKKYYVKKCHCKCCFEPYYPKDDDYQSDSDYNHKKDDDHKSDYDYDHKKDDDHKSDNKCRCKKRYY